jgi:aminoglycoside phosphotransferase (APT) family kinase protein
VGEPNRAEERARALADALQPALTAALADPSLEVAELHRLSGGASRETWGFTLAGSDGTGRALVLQRERPGGVRTGGGMAVEADLIRSAGARGVPVPEVLAAGDDDGLGAPWLVAARLDGETIPRRILRDDALADARAGLAAALGTAAAGIHGIPLDEVGSLDHQDQVVQFRDLLDLLGEPHPAFELGLRWLEANRPPEGPVGVVHGDLRMGNLIVGPDGLRAVLDWELAHLGDGREDLGWLCVRSWRFGGSLPAAGVGTREALCEAYTAAGGRPVEPDDLRWWEALATLKWGVMCIVQAATHLNGLTRSVELAAIGRRVAETEHDLLELISPGSVPAPTAAPDEPPVAVPHDVPTAAQLVEAVREVLEDDVVGGTQGRVQFHARVAGNVLGIVQRELRLGPAQARAHQERLASLGVGDDAELAAGIRAGTLDADDGDVLDAVAASVADKLAVANPGWALST